jgi:Uma2 family endonuclease
MSATAASTGTAVICYVERDEPFVGRTTQQFRWIVTIQGNLDDLFRDVPDVFVAGDHLIYPVEGEPNTRQAPDVYVAFGRPKGDRGSYKVWEEGGIFPQVVFEVWSPNNRFEKMQKKFTFYEKYGVEEYYIVYPDFPCSLAGWRREGEQFVEIGSVDGWVSPRLGIRFEVKPEQLTVYRPDGTRFLTFLELAARAADAQQKATDAQQRAAVEARLREQERQRADRLAARLRELGVDPEAS